jgi:anti-sigma regulatory factor (Ser/Thr protein kinase)
LETTLTIKRTSDAPARARRFVAAALKATPELATKAELLTSELVTNAVVHAKPSDPAAPLRLEVMVDTHGVRVAVIDGDPRADLHPLQVDHSSRCGRGLAIVEALASWGVEPRGEGKAVWFELTF